MIIGLAGLAGCGKSTAATYLADTLGFQRVRLASPLKNMLRAFFRTAGLSDDEIERRIEGDLKEVPDALLGGRSPRDGMIGLGHDWGRCMIDPNVWTSAWMAAARSALDKGAPGVVAEDIRYANEADAIRALGGRVLRIYRPGISAGSHPSEAQDFPVDDGVRNDGDPALMFDRIIVAATRGAAGGMGAPIPAKAA